VRIPWGEHPTQLPSLPYQPAQRPNHRLGLLRVATMSVVSIALALRSAGASTAAVHPAPGPVKGIGYQIATTP
jgi:hypothetical protein